MTDIRIDANLWASTMMPEGILERWLVANDQTVMAGQALAEVRIEDALHAIRAPEAGYLRIHVPVDALIGPGTVVGRVYG